MRTSKKITLRQHLVQIGVAASLGLPAYGVFADVVSTPEVDAAAEQNGTILKQAQELEERVHNLLDKAAQHIKKEGIMGVNDFNRSARFTDNELYVFSLSRDGVLLSSGGWSASLIGENVLAFTDEDRQPFFKTMLDKAKTADKGVVEYLWFNPADGANDPKITHFQVVDNVVIAAGYFPGYSTDEQAKELLDRAVSEYFKDSELALRKFRNRQSGFRDRDQYVFVLDKPSRNLIWNPTAPDLNNQSVDGVEDIQGTEFLAEIVDSASPNVIQQLDYWWFSPLTQRVELRRAFYQQVGDSVIAVGTYTLPNE